MKKIFLKKNFLSCEILILAVLVSAAILFFGQPKEAEAIPLCDCIVDSDCAGYCSDPGIPSGLSWLDPGAYDETELGPTWGLSPAPDRYELIGSASYSGPNNWYWHTGLNPGTYYSYQVRACNTNCNECGNGLCGAVDYSGLCAAGPDVCGAYSSSWGKSTAFHAPTGLGASCDFDGANGKANLSWTDNSSAESGYKVEYKYAGGTYSVYSTELANTISKVVSPLNQGRLVYFRVRAYHNSGTYSDYSNESSCTTPLSAPSGLTATAASDTQINLSWADNSNGETGFKIERATTTCASFVQIATTDADTTTYNNTGLAQGTTYCYRVRAYTSYTNSSYSNTATATTSLPAPSNLTATAASDTQINLSWADNSNGETGFKIERATTTCASFVQIATTLADTTTYNNTGLAQGTTYCYRVRAYTSYADSDYSNTATATTQSPPAAPSNLVATASATSTTQINLTWTDNSGNESGFKVRRAEGASCSGSSPIAATTGAGVTAYSDIGLSQGTQYCYVVCAYNAYGENCSSSATATTSLPAPTGLTCSTQSASQINLSWQDNSANESGFKIERATTTCASFVQIATTGANTTTYNNTGLPQNTTYCYQVRAYTSYTNSSYSNTIFCTTQNPPAAPSNLVATASATSTTQINLTWTDNSGNESGFKVRRAEGASCSGSSPIAATTGAGVTAYSDIGLSQGTQYCYVVCAYNTDGEACSSSATATTSLPAPSNLNFGTIGMTSIALTWTDNSTGESGFKIERAAGACSGFSQIDTASANATTYIDNSPACSGTTYNSYCYRVRAYTSYTNSDYAITTSLKATLPCAATGLGLSVASPTQINLSWTDNSGNESGFKIERKTGAAGTYGEIYSTAANATTYNNTGLGDGTVYYYRLRSYNSDGNSSYSNEAYATTTLAAPSNFVATAISSSQIDLSWMDNSTNESGFKIERATTSPPTTEIATVGQNAASYSNTNLAENTTYYYRVRAYNSNIYSTYSNESSTSTLIYVPHGYLESSTFDSGFTGGVAFINILWKGALPSTSHVRFRFASSNSSTGPWTFLGPDGTETTYYEASGSNVSMPIKTIYHNNHRYFRYRIYLYPTSDNLQSPTVTDVIIGYSP